MEKKKVIAAGHICLDITPMFPDRKVQHPGELLSPGKLLEVGAADVHTGGSVANTGLAMKKLGADVSLMGKVGKDAFGNMILDILKKHDADTDMLIEEGEETSYSVVLAIPGIDRIFLHNAGANRHFKAADIPQEKLEEAALFHFGYPPLMPEMYADNGAELVSLMKRAKAAGVATSLDMAAVDENAPAGQADWKEILKNVLPFVDFLFQVWKNFALCWIVSGFTNGRSGRTDGILRKFWMWKKTSVLWQSSVWSLVQRYC